MGISIHAAREGGDVHASAYTGADRISIHAAREGGDQHDVSQLVCDGISIHAAREGGDVTGAAPKPMRGRFQSTPPVKAATDEICYLRLSRVFQSTPPVKAATSTASHSTMPHPISIHAAREGGDCGKTARAGRNLPFQSTPPVKAATFSSARASSVFAISIHAAREGGDPSMSRGCAGTNYFNPRRP